jgi:hypothetical protein
MSRGFLSICILVLMLVPASARAWEWSLGASMSAATMRSGENRGTSTSFALPSNALTYQPGFRVGYGSKRRTHEVLLDGGALVIGEEGSTVSLIVGSLAYQHAFGRSPTSNPYANLGLGFLREGSALAAGSNATFGAGVGWRRVLREERGDLRAEIRYDYLKSGGPFDRPNLTTVGLRLGFDLWL